MNRSMKTRSRAKVLSIFSGTPTCKRLIRTSRTTMIKNKTIIKSCLISEYSYLLVYYINQSSGEFIPYLKDSKPPISKFWGYTEDRWWYTARKGTQTKNTRSQSCGPQLTLSGGWGKTPTEWSFTLLVCQKKGFELRLLKTWN